MTFPSFSGELDCYFLPALPTSWFLPALLTDKRSWTCPGRCSTADAGVSCLQERSKRCQDTLAPGSTPGRHACYFQHRVCSHLWRRRSCGRWFSHRRHPGCPGWVASLARNGGSEPAGGRPSAYCESVSRSTCLEEQTRHYWTTLQPSFAGGNEHQARGSGRKQRAWDGSYELEASCFPAAAASAFYVWQTIRRNPLLGIKIILWTLHWSSTPGRSVKLHRCAGSGERSLSSPTLLCLGPPGTRQQLKLHQTPAAVSESLRKKHPYFSSPGAPAASCTQGTQLLSYLEMCMMLRWKMEISEGFLNEERD